MSSVVSHHTKRVSIGLDEWFTDGFGLETENSFQYTLRLVVFPSRLRHYTSPCVVSSNPLQLLRIRPTAAFSLVHSSRPQAGCIVAERLLAHDARHELRLGDRRLVNGKL